MKNNIDLPGSCRHHQDTEHEGPLAIFFLKTQGLGWDLMFEAETEVEAEAEAKERLKRTHCKSKRLDYLEA